MRVILTMDQMMAEIAVLAKAWGDLSSHDVYRLEYLMECVTPKLR